PAPQARPEPAVPVKRSVFADYIVCLEDGKKMKMLKRHLMTSYGLTPQAYRERWGLPPDYPMVAPSYADKRSALAKSIGLGRKPGGAVTATVAPEVVEAAPEEKQVTPIPKTRGRKLAKAAEAHEE
ncbi:MAG: MucR family transcriptional regulator, partial [Janthinobacterium lividum]